MIYFIILCRLSYISYKTAKKNAHKDEIPDRFYGLSRMFILCQTVGEILIH